MSYLHPDAAVVDVRSPRRRRNPRLVQARRPDDVVMHVVVGEVVLVDVLRLQDVLQRRRAKYSFTHLYSRKTRRCPISGANEGLYTPW